MTDAHIAAVADGAPTTQPQQTLHVPAIQLAASEASSGDTSPSDPFSYGDAASSSGHSDTTCHSPTAVAITMAKPTPANIVRLISMNPISDIPLLHMEYTVSEPDQEELVLQVQDEPDTVCTIWDVFYRYSSNIESLIVDVTGVANPESPETTVEAIELPFAPHVARGGSARSLPDLRTLKRFAVTSHRAVSIRSILTFLNYCPMLIDLAIHNFMRHTAVFPEDVDKLPHPGLSKLKEVIIDGLLIKTVESLFKRLGGGATNVQVTFYGTGTPVLEHGPALQKLFSNMRDASATFLQFTTPEPALLQSVGSWALSRLQQRHSPTTSPQPTLASARPLDRCLFTFGDSEQHVQFHWRWTPAHDSTPPNLGHIGLASPVFSAVRNLALTLRDVDPSYYDLERLFSPLRGLRKLEVLSTHRRKRNPRAEPAVEAEEVPSAPTSGPSTSEPLAGPSSLPAVSAPAPRTSAMGPSVEREREPECEFVSFKRVYTIRRGLSAVLRAVPRVLAIGLVQRLHSHLHEVVNDDEKAQSGTGVPAHMRRLARFVYDPLWALMVRERME